MREYINTSDEVIAIRELIYNESSLVLTSRNSYERLKMIMLPSFSK